MEASAVKAMRTLHTAFTTHFLESNFLKISTIQYLFQYSRSKRKKGIIKYKVEPDYNDIGLSDTSYITSEVLWYKLIPRC